MVWKCSIVVDCLRLLASATIGRVGISIGALPVVLPVNFRLVDDRIVFCTGIGTKLDAATANSVVAFEVDDFEPVSHTGWSVVVTGIAHEVVDHAGARGAAARPTSLGGRGRARAVSWRSTPTGSPAAGSPTPLPAASWTGTAPDLAGGAAVTVTDPAKDNVPGRHT